MVQARRSRASDGSGRAMNDFLFLVPISIAMGIVGLIVFLWTLRSDQYEDLDGAAYRILDDEDAPIKERKSSK